MWECNSLLKTPHSALQLHWAIKGFVLKSSYRYVSESYLWLVFPFSSVLRIEKIQTETKHLSCMFWQLKEYRTLQQHTITTWMFPTEDNHQARAEQDSYSETEQNYMTAIVSCNPKCRRLVGESKRGGAEGIILCSFPTSPCLNGWWKFKWLQDSQRHPSGLQYRPYPHDLISFYERQWWDARKWTKPTFAKGMEKQKQVVK